MSSPLARTLAGLALLTGVRRGELFALRWQDVDEQQRGLQVRAAVYEGVFDDPKTTASLRTIPLPEAAMNLLQTWKARAAVLTRNLVLLERIDLAAVRG